MLKKLFVQNLRCISKLELIPKKGINIIVGDNGSGKTTLLESIQIIFRGKSFRHKEIAPLIKDQEEELLLTAIFEGTSDKKTHQIGVKKSKSQTEVHLDGDKKPKRSEVMSLLPIQWIGPEPQNLITGNPASRRSFLDNGLFHVERNYLPTLQSYNRALNQRNAALKTDPANANAWDQQLNQFANEINELRSEYFNKLQAQVNRHLSKWEIDINVDLSYEKGWPRNQELIDCLSETLSLDLKRQFTGYGPHKADLVINSAKHKSGNKLSRGQLKMVATAFHFSQSKITENKSNKKEILLYDDISAELDKKNRAILFNYIYKNFDQTFITTLSTSDISLDANTVALFHVEHGKLQQN